VDDRVSLHYQYLQRRGFDSAAFVNDLKTMAGTAMVEIFVG
jgi:hypothetical protein